MNLARRASLSILKTRFLAALGAIVVSLTSSPPAMAADDASELVELVAGFLQDKDKDVRALGLDQVRTAAKGAAGSAKFAALLPKLPPESQVGLLSALADRGDTAARPAVLDLLEKSKDPAVRVAAIQAIGYFGEPADLPLLLESLPSADAPEQAAARASLVRLRGNGVNAALATELKSAPTANRVRLIEILTARRALDSIPTLLTAAVDDDATVRTAAMLALGQLATTEHLPAMLPGVLKAEKGPERDAAERAVAAVCARGADAAGPSPGEERAKPLIAAIEKLNKADATALLPTLGRVGAADALKVVEAAIADPMRHEQGIQALANWPDASVAPRLIELAQNDKQPEDQRIALAALIRVAPLPDKRSAADRLALTKKVFEMCRTDEDRSTVLKRARAIRTIETLRFVAPFLDQPTFAQQVAETIVELAHHRELRDANKQEFHQALDRVIKISKDPVVVERANRYKRGQTWAKPMAGGPA